MQIIIDPYEVRFILVTSRSMVELRSGHAFAYCCGETVDVFEPSLGCRTQTPIRFHTLLGQVVSTLSQNAAGDEMTLTFQNGESLTIRSEVGGQYESGMISGMVDGEKWLWAF